MRRLRLELHAEDPAEAAAELKARESKVSETIRRHHKSKASRRITSTFLANMCAKVLGGLNPGMASCSERQRR